MSSFAAKAKAKAVKAAAIAKAKAKEVDAKHNIVAKTKSGARRASAKISAAADSAKTAVDGAMTAEQQQNAVMGATLGLSALSMVGVPGAGAALTGIALGGTAASLHSQQKAQGGKLTQEQMLGGAIGMGSAVGGAKTRLAMGAVNMGMQVNQQQNGGGGGGGGGDGWHTPFRRDGR